VAAATTKPLNAWGETYVCNILQEQAGACVPLRTIQRCGTVTIFYGSGSGFDFWKSFGSGSGSGSDF
jgi:hypothetical protein